MGLQIRRVSKVRVIATLIAVFALVAQPIHSFLSVQIAHAQSTDVAVVTNEVDLLNAAADKTVRTISVKSNILVSQKIVFSGRNVYIDGNGNKITFSGDATGWGGNYVIQAYKNLVTIKNLSITGGDAAIYANGATVKAEGFVDLTGNEFGGVEVSQGAGVVSPASFNAGDAIIRNNSEVSTKPTVWIDRVSTADATVSGAFTKTTHIGLDQSQFYLKEANADIAAVNTTTNETFATVQNAIDDPETLDGHTIRLAKNITLPSKSIRVTKNVTIDGDNKTVSTQFNRGEGGVSNAGFVVLKSGTAIKNVTIEGNGTGTNAAHGIVLDKSLNNIVLIDIVVKNNAAGAIVNSSAATIKNIKTINNTWYGINVDGKYGPAQLTIKGVNSHTESAPIYVDDRTTVKVIDDDTQYVKKAVPSKPAADYYVYDNDAPLVTLTAPVANSSHKGAVDIKATIEDANLSHYYLTVSNRVDSSAAWTTHKAVQVSREAFTNEVIYTVPASVTGEIRVKLEARDKAGNKNDTLSVKTLNFVIDKTAPTVMINDTTIVNKQLSFTIFGTDNLSGIKKVGVNIYNQSNTGNPLKKIGTQAEGLPARQLVYSGQVSNIDLSDLPDGVYTIRAAIRDYAENLTYATKQIVVDSTKPTVTITSASRNADGTYTISGTGEQGAPVTVKVNGSSLESIAPDEDGKWTAKTAKLNDGLYEVVASSVNGLGNEGTSDVFKFTATTPAAPEVTAPVDGSTGSGLSEGGLTLLPSVASLATTISTPPTRSFLGVPVDDLVANNETQQASIAESPEILGARDVKNNVAAVSGPVTATESGWKLFGLAWYWWLVALAAIASIWWFIAAWRRRKSEDQPSFLG